MHLIPPLLDWALKSASMFNTILLVWLGLTVLLNAEKRAWGIWLAGCGLLLGAAFFAGQTASLEYPIESLFGQLRLWWYPAWICVILLPLGWYILMLWYVGFGEGTPPSLERHRIRLVLLCTGAILLIWLLWFVNPFRVIQQMTHLEGMRAVTGWPLLVIAYLPFVLGCQLSSIAALRKPGPSARMMGDLARRRARPYLITSSLLQLAVSLLVASALAWAVAQLFRDGVGSFELLRLVIDLVDFAATGLIGLAVIFLGKAIVSYEIFTGKPLPRRGFLRQWRSFVTVAGAYSILVSLAWALPLRPVYPLLLTTLLLAVTYALFSWRSFAEREDFIDHLRPFVASQNLYEHLLQRGGELENPSLDALHAAPQFRALCEGFLLTDSAHLIPLGPLATLAPAPLSHGPIAPPPSSEVRALSARFSSPRLACLGVKPSECGGAEWAVPLWGERGVIGVLLLGPRRGGGLYAQEEIEIARANGERLLDAQAGAEVAGRLMSLQRRKLAEGQIIDRRARRVLHDDILPQLHAAMLQLSSSQDAEVQEGVSQLALVHRGISQVLREMPLSTTPEWSRRGLVPALREMAEHEFGSAFDAIEWRIEDGAEERALALPPLTGETVFYAAREAIRNAARYARAHDLRDLNGVSSTSETSASTWEAPSSTCERALTLRVSIRASDGIEVEVEDDGVGLPNLQNDEKPGSNGGSGSGLALHSTLLAVVGGSLSIESEPGKFTRVSIALPDSALLSLGESVSNTMDTTKA